MIKMAPVEIAKSNAKLVNSRIITVYYVRKEVLVGILLILLNATVYPDIIISKDN